MTEDLILDGSKIAYYMDRVEAWERGERIAPITIDMALTRKCDASCSFCYAMLQANPEQEITRDVMAGFLEDSARMGVRGISLVSDGESLLSPIYQYTIQEGVRMGLSMASGTNGRMFTPTLLNAVLPFLTYLRFNVSAGTPERYAEIMGFRVKDYERVIENIQHAVAYKWKYDRDVTLGIQMVLMPQDADQIIPFAQLGIDLGVDYAIIKHTSDDEAGNLHVDYDGYDDLAPLLVQAEAMSTDRTRIAIKWNKIQAGNRREYSRCYGPPFIIQLSGSGLVAPCGQLFNSRYAKFHIGNIGETRWWDIWQSERYWQVMRYLASDEFDAKRMCGSLCLQDRTNLALHHHVGGTHRLVRPEGSMPEHLSFI